MRGTSQKSGCFRSLIDSSTSNTTNQTLIDTTSITSSYNAYTSTHLISHAIYVESLIATVRVKNSLTVAPIADISPLDSFASSMSKTLEIEQKNQRIQLDLLLDISDGLGWIACGSLFLLNYGAEYTQQLLTPYLTPNAVLPISNTTKLGYSLLDIGFGKLKGGDYLLIEGSYSITTSVLQKPF